jgi:3-carboxy-cis,cis-muconate cycloisomerase
MVGPAGSMTNPLAPSLLLPPLISSVAMRAILDDRARLQRMLDFEAALTRAEAAVGVVPASAVDPIAAACRAELYDIAALGEAATAAGSLAGPLVDALTAEVAKTDAAAASCVHWGASGQDVMDTALVLELRVGIDALISDLGRAIEAFTTLAGRQRRTATVARMSLRHALPMPFGLKVAGYAAALGRSRERLKRLRKDALVLQFGGSVGTLAALGDQGLNVTDRLSAQLDLPAPEAPWHSYRDRLAEVASAFGILAGTCGKIGRDIALLMQDEVAEIFEPPPAPSGEGTAAPPRRLGPAAAAAMAVSAAMIAPQLVATILACETQEHEHALATWQAEWATFPALALVTSGALGAVADLAQGIEVDPDRMRTNLDITQGLIMAEAITLALAGKISRPEARKLVEEARQNAARDKSRLQDVLLADARVTAHLPAPVLARLFEPMSHQGTAQTFIDRLIGTLRTSAGKRP